MTGVAFMFPGLGAHYPNMARGLYEDLPEFRARMGSFFAFLQTRFGLDLEPVLYPGSYERPRPDARPDLRRIVMGAAAGGAGAGPEALDPLDRAVHAHPALLAVELALAELLQRRGVRPGAMIGHSIGEYVAASVAGVFTAEDALALATTRAMLLEDLPAAGMLAVPVTEEELRDHLTDGLHLATLCHPELCVVSGLAADLCGLEERLTAAGILHRRLPTTHGFHSPLMDGVCEPLLELLRETPMKPPEIPFVSNVTGTWITAEQACDPCYWVEQTRRTVRFSQGVSTLLSRGCADLLEVGPGQTLASFALQNPTFRAAPGGRLLSTLRNPGDPKDDAVFLDRALADLAPAGAVTTREHPAS